MSKRSVKVGLIQSAVGADKAQNLAKTARLVEDAAGRGARIVCLQELFASEYFCQREDAELFNLAEPVPGPTTEAMAAVAKARGVSVVVPLFERRAAGVYHNSLVLVSPKGDIAGHYRKMHIPDDPLFYEKYYFTPGDLGFMAIPTPEANVGPLICWDQWYPEAARMTAMSGAEILVYPTAIGWHPKEKAQYGASQLSAWQTIQRAHAIANGVFVVAVNRVGHEGPAEGGLDFWGHSFVADPFGVVLAEAGEGEETLVVECDLGRVEEVRRNWPFFRDRRIDAYGGITSRFLDRTGR
ncbi:MAG TPA: carbon-nitrogen hydrolase [Polyangiaceae bacterium]|nr:carbon-nitrogen hydrolase [Polyangiaceae bacterium]